jgi:tetrahydromethanopterin S-methyltransferase subunit G
VDETRHAEVMKRLDDLGAKLELLIGQRGA